MNSVLEQVRALIVDIKGGAIQRMESAFNALKTDLSNEIERIKSNVEASDINGESRYVTEITVSGDKDTFYPVVFQMPRGEETKVQVYRGYDWNKKGSKDESDFDSTHVGSALVLLRGQAHNWDGDARYLRTVINYQRYRQCVAAVGFQAYCQAEKIDPSGINSKYNAEGLGYTARRHSGFMLRGGRLKYQIISNKPIKFALMNDGDVIESMLDQNVQWVAKTLPLSSFETGDEFNNHSTTYISYDKPEVSA